MQRPDFKMKTKATIIVFLALNLCATMNLVKCEDNVPSTFDPPLTKSETGISFDDIIEKFYISQLQPAFDDVLSQFKQMVAKYDELDPDDKSLHLLMLQKMVNELNIVTATLTNAERTYRMVFDAIYR